MQSGEGICRWACRELGLSYRTFFGRQVTQETLKRVAYAVVAVAALGVAILIVLAIQKV